MSAIAERQILTTKGIAETRVEPVEIRIALDAINEQPRSNGDGHHYLDFTRFYELKFPGSGLPKPVRLSPELRRFLDTVRPEKKTIQAEDVRIKLDEEDSLIVTRDYSDKETKLQVRSKKTKQRGSYVNLPEDGTLTILFHADMSADGTGLEFMPRIADISSDDRYGKQSPAIEGQILNRLGIFAGALKFPYPVRVKNMMGYELSPYWNGKERFVRQTGWGGPYASLHSYPTSRMSFDIEPPYFENDQGGGFLTPTNEELSLAFVQSLSYTAALQESFITVSIK